MELDEPETVAVSGGALAALLESSVESTVVIESGSVHAVERTERTFLPPPPLVPRDSGSISFAPVAYTPTSIIVPPPRQMTAPAFARAAMSLAIGLGIGLVSALGVGGVGHGASAAGATAVTAKHVARAASDAKVALDATLHDKASPTTKRRRGMMMLPVHPVAPPPAPSPAPATGALDALGDAQLGRPF